MYTENIGQRTKNRQTDRKTNYRGISILMDHWVSRITLVGLEKMSLRTENRQTDRETNYRGHSNPRWIIGLSGPILSSVQLFSTVCCV